uniref:Uncharacterized protein n=1 Tax=Caenorhabditis tropicalis TaxID=1561998 RepID=A0A1I7T1G4_9PELO
MRRTVPKRIIQPDHSKVTDYPIYSTTEVTTTDVTTADITTAMADEAVATTAEENRKFWLFCQPKKEHGGRLFESYIENNNII